MLKKPLFFISVFVVAAVIIGFTINSWNDKTTVADYINSGGPVNKIQDVSDPSPMIPLWSSGANMPAPTRYHGSGVGYHRNDTNWLICFGGDDNGSGNNSSVVSIYNATTNTWSTGAPMPATLVFYHSATRLGDTAYIVGGIGPGGAFTSMVNEVKRYNIRTNTWLSNAANYPTTVADGKAKGYQDSLIYVVGGLINGTSSATVNVNVYNKFTNSWRACTPLPAARSGGAMAITGDTIVYVCGGTGYNTGLANTVYRGVISQTDRSVITWTTGATYPGTSRHRFDAENWGCQGIVTSPGSASGFTTSVECYRYFNNTWTAMPNKPTTTSAAFVGSAWRTGNIYRFIVASGLVLSPPYSIPQCEILTDTLCPVPTGPQTTLCRNGLNKPINDFLTTFDTVTMIGNTGCTIFDVNIRIDTVLHTWDADLIFRVSHAGTVVRIINRVGGSGDNFINTVINDSGACRIGSTGCNTAPFTGTFAPSVGDSLVRFNGLTPSGAWILGITDTAAGDTGFLRAWCVVVSYSCPTGGIKQVEIPNYYSLSQNYPNPFNPTTTIKFGLPKAGNVKLVVFDILGREVATLINNEFRDVGTYTVNFDASALSSGVYFYRLESGDFSQTKKMLLVK